MSFVWNYVVLCGIMWYYVVSCGALWGFNVYIVLCTVWMYLENREEWYVVVWCGIL